jgi:hypothetical protein
VSREYRARFAPPVPVREKHHGTSRRFPAALRRFLEPPVRQDRCFAGTTDGAANMTVVVNKDGGGSGGGSVVLSFILGAVVLVVAVVGFFMWDNYKSGGAPKAVVITQPK